MALPYTIKGLDHIVLLVRDLDKSVAFYRMLCGHVEERPGHSAHVALGPTQHVLLHPDPDYVAQGKNPLQHFNLVVEGSGTVEELLDYVRANGAEPYYDGPPNEGRGFFQFRVSDPDGNTVELRAFMKKE